MTRLIRLNVVLWLCASGLQAQPGHATSQLTSHGQAAAPGFSLRLSSPPDCQRRAQLEAAIRRLVPAVEQHSVEVTVTFQAQKGAWAATVELAGTQAGRRQLQAPDCSSAVRASALIVALALDPQAALAATEEPAVAQPEPELESEPTTAAPPTRPLMRQPRDPGNDLKAPESAESALRVDVGAGLSSAPLPRAALGASAQVVYDWRWLRAGAGGYYAPAVTVEQGTSSGSFQLSRLHAELCVHSLADPMLSGPVHLCAGLQGNMIRGEATGAAQNTPTTEVVYAARGIASWLLLPDNTVSPSLALGVELPLSKVDFEIENGQRLFDVGDVGVLARLGVSVRVF